MCVDSRGCNDGFFELDVRRARRDSSYVEGIETRSACLRNQRYVPMAYHPRTWWLGKVWCSVLATLLRKPACFLSAIRVRHRFDWLCFSVSPAQQSTLWRVWPLRLVLN